MAQKNKENNDNKKKIRIYVDGCWDVMHSGHYNALRQAKGLGDILVLGICSDEEIGKHKREPVMKNEERLAAVRACKWVDEVVFDVPYSPTPELLTRKDVNCDYVAHGDDICIDAITGKSAYHLVEDKLKIFKRTPGISTTTLIQRLLLASQYYKNKNKNNNNNNNDNNDEQNQDEQNQDEKKVNKKENIVKMSSWSSFLPTSYRVSAFSNQRLPKDTDKIIYIDGDFDLFHIGHIKVLEQCKKKGDFVYVGIYDDKIVSEKKGPYFPIMNLQERVLTVLSCRYVDEVIIGCPYVINQDMIKVLNISKIITSPNTTMKVMDNAKEEQERYNIASDLDILEHIEIKDCALTTYDIMKRILKDHEKLQQQNQKRINKEADYVQTRSYVTEK